VAAGTAADGSPPSAERMDPVASLRQTLPSASAENAQAAAQAIGSLQRTQEHASAAAPPAPPQADAAIQSLQRTIPPASAPVPAIPGTPGSLSGAGPVPRS
jgi:hypothetical protein